MPTRSSNGSNGNGSNGETVIESNEARPAQREMRRIGVVLRERKWTIIIVALLVTGAALALSFVETPVYTASAQVLVQSGPGDSAASASSAMATEKQVASSAAVAKAVITRLHLSTTPEALLNQVSVDVPVNTQVLNVSYSDTSPRTAQVRAQAFADAYLDFRGQQLLAALNSSLDPIKAQIEDLTAQLNSVQQQLVVEKDRTKQVILNTKASSLITQIGILEQQAATLSSQQNLLPGRVIEQATLPQHPSRPNYKVNALLGLFAGLSLGVLVAMLRERSEDRVRERMDLETEMGTPVLAVVPVIKGLRGSVGRDLVTVGQPDSPAAEAFRQLRVNVMFAATRTATKSILITSCGEKEGKTFTAANLAITLARSGKHVVLVSADLRKPRLDQVFGVERTSGMTDVLMERSSALSSLRDVGIANLAFLPSGSATSHPEELLVSGPLTAMMEELENHADFVIVDAAPILAVADASILANVCDGVLFIVDARTATTGVLGEARQQLARTGATLLGAVMANARVSALYGYPYGGRRGGGYGSDSARPVPAESNGSGTVASTESTRA
jgi:capsular exopolysaccharide synthesis family protein